MNHTEKLTEYINILREAGIDYSQGLPEELFLYVSSVTPIPNVDLLITNEKKQLLLSWRDDPYFGRGWHIPGGCIRFGETMYERIQKTALEEIGAEVIVNGGPIAVKDVICKGRTGLKNPNERGHQLAILYDCNVQGNYKICNGDKKENAPGYLKWFDRIPEDILSVHEVYKEILNHWEKTREENEKLE